MAATVESVNLRYGIDFYKKSASLSDLLEGAQGT